MKVLITGGAGFIGSHLTELLESKGFEITILDKLSTGSKRNLEDIDFNGVFVNGDIRDSEIVENLISKCDYVVHLAAALGVSNIMNRTLESLSVNIVGSEVVLKGSAEKKKPILIASTSEVYGKNPKQPLSENDDRVIGNPQNFRWSYSDSKAIEESIASSLAVTHDLKVATVRFFNTVGPRQSAQYGMVLPRFVSSAINSQPLLVHGTGEQTRVFCHVSDAVSAVWTLMQSDKVYGEVFNVGGIGEVSINTLAQKVIDLTHSSSLVEHVSYESVYPSGFEDMQRRVPNIDKIFGFTGWKPQKDLEEIILDTENYIRK